MPINAAGGSMSDHTQDTASTTADNPATTTTADVVDENATGTDTGSTTGDFAEPAPPAPPAKPWDGAQSLDVHVKLEHLWAWAQAEIAKLHARIDELSGGGQSQNVETPAETINPAKEA
jgi:hypothetical protein